jgi:hypothetical protein
VTEHDDAPAFRWRMFWILLAVTIAVCQLIDLVDPFDMLP